MGEEAVSGRLKWSEMERNGRGAPDMASDLMTVEEAARRLGVTPPTVLRWVKSGELRAIRLGGKAGWRVSAADLQEFVDSRANRPPKAGRDAA
jgi:excisionase family DNA binding protein